MLFNSFLFLFAFLPVTLTGFFLVSRYRQVYGAAWLTLASLVFYAAWNPRYLILLLGSIAFNFVAGRNIGRLSGKTTGCSDILNMPPSSRRISESSWAVQLPSCG
jgi:D-alanyl-lipoteichoic acid acyltransferase DltB (MBOAT superfamily)